MAGHTFFGKRKLCYTETSDFTDFQGIGHDPMYKRYDSVFSVVKRAIPVEYQHFLATPEYNDEFDQICWHVENWEEHPIRLTDLSENDKTKYKEILNKTVSTYKSSVANLNGDDLQIMAGAIKYIDENRIYCADGKVYLVAWGMTPDTKQHKVIGSVIHDFDYVKKFKVTFDVGEHGILSSKLDKSMNREEGHELSPSDIPEVIPNKGWVFEGWSPSPVGLSVNSDLRFEAKYVKSSIPTPPPPQEDDNHEDTKEPEPVFFTCRFDAGENGSVNGMDTITKEAHSSLSDNDIPTITPHKGYRFVGWNNSPYNTVVDEDKVFTAQYEKDIPWYKRWWLWLTGLFTGKSCLKWLLWLLLGILLMWLLSWLLRGCNGCAGHHAVNGVVPIDTITRSDNTVIDDNGHPRKITDDNGTLPEDGSIVAPVFGEGGTEPPIVSQPGMPSILANRLFLFMEDENGDINGLAQDFKKAYPEEQYSIIGFDKEVKLLVIQIPESERDQIRQTINSRIPNHKFIVFDEEIYELHGFISDDTSDKGWHLGAIHLKEGWSYTRGDSNVKVAIVDDGIQSGHPMFDGRIVDAYNVFTQNNSLSLGEGHGTHTAGLAVGNDSYYSQGASGVAPNCKLMPIQVFDNKICPLSALIAGIMYAVHHDADVVNISIGPSFQGLNVLPVEQQDEIAKKQFMNVAFLWARVCKLAAQKNCILVFAAGNDDILTSIPPENRNESSIVVTAVDKRMYPTVFTNYGPCSDISAPGKSIYSSFPTSSFQSCDGTSMAAPIVAGTIALMKSIKRDLTVQQARDVLFSTGADVYGWIPPMVLVDKALMATKNGNFNRIEREGHSVPDGVDIHLHSGRIPVRSDIGVIVEQPVPVQQLPGTDTDYDAIRRKIAEYKKKIEELEKLLPKN